MKRVFHFLASNLEVIAVLTVTLRLQIVFLAPVAGSYPPIDGRIAALRESRHTAAIAH